MKNLPSDTSKESVDSHITAATPTESPALVSANPIAAAPLAASSEAPPPMHAAALLPPAIRDRKFRALSFAAKLNEMQRAMLSAWLANDQYSIEEIRQKVAAAPPAGFGLQVQPTTLRRLRKFFENSRVTTWIGDALDTACDVLEDDSVSEAAPLREALTLMLYSRALNAAKNQVEPERIDKLVTTIAKLEKLKTPSGRQPRSAPSETTSRHHVELSIVPSPKARSSANVINVTALPASGPASDKPASLPP